MRAFMVLIAVAATGCASSPKQPTAAPAYLVTQEPLEVGERIRLCIAVKPDDVNGVWWWSPGATGCVTRSSGPDVTRAEQATVSQSSPTSPTLVGFRLGTHSAARPFIDVRLHVESGEMRADESGAHVALERRADLNVPDLLPEG